MSEVEFKKLAREMSREGNGQSSILLLLILSFVAIFIMWSSITELDNVVRGTGKTVSEVQNQLVQSSEPGVIQKRFVSEGDLVEKGSILFEIDPIDAKTQLDQAKKRFQSLVIKSERLRAEVDGRLPNFTPEMDDANGETISTELSLYNARLDDLKSKSAILDQRRAQKLNEIKEAKIEFETATNNLTLIRQEIDTVEPLVRSGIAPATRLITLQREEKTELGKASSAETAQERLKAGLVEIDEQLLAEKQSYITSALTDLSSIQGEVSELSARIPALEDRVDRTSVRAPVDGVVNRINYVTNDAYVSTGDVLLELVPTGTNLIVEAKIDPKDIADVLLGQDVKISLTAYDASRYGRIDGKVLGISADAISDSESDRQFYLADVSLETDLFEDDGSPVIILPGMVASIDVLSGKRTILEYFWQPIARTKDRALRD